ncbi:hypothetical protein [Leptospira jelokensis]|uniref:hypothetical protein n=1 Tax=Leptospira jelokensis TaxID=2484931 RepID=UPI0010910996|nr:hypothetical protein [Leptospira jelokensis]TGM01955.1 hypothetical protein EHQ79_11215 [Leptospira jelokensis]
MRYPLLFVLFLFPIMSVHSQSVAIFPKVQNEGASVSNPNLSWQIQTRITPSIDGQNIFSIRYHSDGKSALIGTTDFYLYRISLVDGSLIWKTEAKMQYQKEFDGPKIFDVSPDGQFFLSFGQTDPNSQSSERYLVIRSSANGSIMKSFPAENSLFYSVTADIDYRYPGDESKTNREEAGLSPNWILTIDNAKFIENGKKILVSYKHNMEGPNFYDRRFMIYDTATGNKLNDFQLTADPNSADWTQPAGFEIAHLQLPFQYIQKRNSILYGNAHGRIHEITPSVMNQNMSIEIVEEKPAGPIVYIPRSDSEDIETKDRQTIRSVAITPDGNHLFCSAGVETGFIQLYGFNLSTKKEMFRSSFFDAGEIYAPSNQILIIGGLYSTGKVYIVDTKLGELLFVSNDDESYIHPNLLAVHPKQKEVLGLSTGNQIVILRPQGGSSPW